MKRCNIFGISTGSPAFCNTISTIYKNTSQYTLLGSYYKVLSNTPPTIPYHWHQNCSPLLLVSRAERESAPIISCNGCIALYLNISTHAPISLLSSTSSLFHIMASSSTAHSQADPQHRNTATHGRSNHNAAPPLHRYSSR
jgi:hypothetical protein